MTTFELFCLMYKAFDTPENHTDFSFEDFLSDLDPYVWEDLNSADPAEFEEFSKFIVDKTIGSDYGFSLVEKYISQIERPWVEKPISFYFQITKEDWINMATSYLNSPHKGEIS